MTFGARNICFQSHFKLKLGGEHDAFTITDCNVLAINGYTIILTAIAEALVISLYPAHQLRDHTARGLATLRLLDQATHTSETSNFAGSRRGVSLEFGLLAIWPLKRLI